MLVAALLVIPVVVLDTGEYGKPWDTIGDVLNWMTWLAFAGEAAVMLALVPRRMAWIRANPIDVIVVVLTPPFLPALASVRLVRLLRLLRLLRLHRVARKLFTQEGLRAAGLLSALVAVGGGVAYSAIEPKVSPLRGLYWAITTMTTVGYGDIRPHTDGGRVLAVGVMIVGIGFVAILTGAIAQRFITPGLARDVATAEVEIGQKVGAAEDELFLELRALARRLTELEDALSRRRATGERS